MIAKIAAFFAGLAAIFAALFYRSEAKRKDDKLVAEKGARETEHKATDALIDGMKKESEVTDEIPNNPDTDIFIGK